MSDDFRRYLATAAVLAGLSAVGGLVSAVSAQQIGTEAEPQQGFLLLRNGQLLEGKIIPLGDHYCVAVDGGEIRVRASDVEFCCRDLEEGYRRKRAQVRLGDVNDHLALAQWCQRHGLIGYAAEQLAAAMAADPAHPMIPIVERRVTMSLAERESTERPAEPADPAPSFDDLDRLVRGLSPGSMETFTQTIQPLLMNHCSVAGCHGPRTESTFRLLRLPPGRPASRRLTQRNLHSTLQWIDREQPAASPLLTAPIRPHGTARAAVFTNHRAAQYKQILDWVHWVARSEAVLPASHERQADEPVGQATAAVHLAADPGATDEFVPPNRSDPSSEETLEDHPADPRLRPFESDDGLLCPKPRVQRGAPPPQFVPVDPFDPKIFNRRFFPANPAGATETP